MLVVDDEPLIRWSICSGLAAEGFDPVPAADFVEAQRRATEWPPPRVAIVDRRFTHGDDQDLLTLIRRVYPACRFLVLTTAENGARARLASDQIEIVEKPFDLGRVVALVGELTATARSQTFTWVGSADGLRR